MRNRETPRIHRQCSAIVDTNTSVALESLSIRSSTHSPLGLSQCSLTAWACGYERLRTTGNATAGVGVIWADTFSLGLTVRRNKKGYSRPPLGNGTSRSSVLHTVLPTQSRTIHTLFGPIKPGIGRTHLRNTENRTVDRLAYGGAATAPTEGAMPSQADVRVALSPLSPVWYSVC